MTSAAIQLRAPEWVSVIHELGLEWGDPVLVMGDRARGVAEAYQADGAPPVGYDRPGFAYLSTKPVASMEKAAPGATGLDDESVGLVSLRRAWKNAAGLATAVTEAARILRPGGALVLTDLDLDRFSGSPPHRYPAWLVYSQLPALVARLRAARIPPTDMATRATAARFQRVTALDVDETLGGFDGADAYIDFLRGSDRLSGVDPEAAEAALDAAGAALTRLVPLGSITEREPWRVVGAVKA